MKFLMLILLFQANIAAADVYKCQGEDGKVIFQKAPCLGVDAKPLNLKQPSPELLLKMEHEAKLRDLDEKYRKSVEEKRAFEEAKREAELRAIKAREDASNQLNYDIQKSREDSERRQAEWDARERCRNNLMTSPYDNCWKYR